MLGHYMPDGPLRDRNLEVKLSETEAGRCRPEAQATSFPVRTMQMLLSGRYEACFPDGTVVLEKPGDFVISEAGTPHWWKALENTVILTLRWPDGRIVPDPSSRE
jgi:uncharacterized cupin superfamily protein